MDEDGSLGQLVSDTEQRGLKFVYNHSSVRDKRVVPTAHFGNGFQQPGSELISKSKGVDGGWELAHGPQLGDVSLCRTHVVGHAVGQDHEGRHISCAVVVDVFKELDAGQNSSPQIGRIFRRHFFNPLRGGPLGCPGHGGEGLHDLCDMLASQSTPWFDSLGEQDLPLLA